jgi:hypothetical protein
LGAAAISSACVGRRFSVNWSTFHPPATISHEPGFMVREASVIRPSASFSDRAPIQLTSVVKLRAARMACMCESINPGITVRPPRSIIRVSLPASLRISESLPSAATLPSRTAAAA